jgi:hypothetical protein
MKYFFLVGPSGKMDNSGYQPDTGRESRAANFGREKKNSRGLGEAKERQERDHSLVPEGLSFGHSKYTG